MSNDFGGGLFTKVLRKFFFVFLFKKHQQHPLLRVDSNWYLLGKVIITEFFEELISSTLLILQQFSSFASVSFFQYYY